MRLWLDDIRPAPSGWEWARTNVQAQEFLLTGQVVECSLDHDLGYHDVEIPDDPEQLLEVITLHGTSEETGYDLVCWMLENNLVPKKVTIHSWNPDGAKRMAARLSRLSSEDIEVWVVPFKT